MSGANAILHRQTLHSAMANLNDVMLKTPVSISARAALRQQGAISIPHACSAVPVQHCPMSSEAQNTCCWGIAPTCTWCQSRDEHLGKLQAAHLPESRSTHPAARGRRCSKLAHLVCPFDVWQHGPLPGPCMLLALCSIGDVQCCGIRTQQSTCQIHCHRCACFERGLHPAPLCQPVAWNSTEALRVVIMPRL